jgi:Fic family protein
VRAAATVGADIDPVVYAAAFGFVFIHPFIDGNGRLHRYLLHEELSTLGFTPGQFRAFNCPDSSRCRLGKRTLKMHIETWGQDDQLSVP